jgi:hypothetical protein
MYFTAFATPSGFDTGDLAVQVVCCDGHISGARLHGWFLTVKHQESETVDIWYQDNVLKHIFTYLPSPAAHNINKKITMLSSQTNVMIKRTSGYIETAIRKRIAT